MKAGDPKSIDPNLIDPKTVPSFTLSSGEKVPCIGMGTFGSDRYAPSEVAAAVAGAIRFGYRLFDCASVYGNESLIGGVFDGALKSGAVERKDLFIISKVWNDMHGRGGVLLSLAKTLKDLALEYVDLYLVHWPFPNYHAPGCDGDARNPDSVPFSAGDYMAVWAQMEKIADAKLARYIGMSNMTVGKLKAVLPHCRIRPAFIEMEQHPSFQQQELFDYCAGEGIQVIGYCPLGSPNRPERDKSPDDVIDMELPEIAAIAASRGIHPAQACLKWAVKRGSIPIPFSVHGKNYQGNLLAVTGDLLSDAEMEAMKKAERNCRLVKGQVFLWPGAKGWEDLWD
ncbi:MAG: aldo/keto reductase [Treponema sp.]|jgi:alcohol dehydrogenase (NADP+)|nr:aldo/keto reductase [Treponema sp.]